MKAKVAVLLLLSLLFGRHNVKANLISATPSNYTLYINGLLPGDTLYLTAGSYTHQLNLNNLSGTSANPIVIMGAGNTTVFPGNACCNTVQINNCAYVVIKNFKIDGQNINYAFGVSAGGGGMHYAHHITLENLYIINNGGNITGDNQTDGISTKCAAWNWTIRGCTIIAAGTGLYLGNSDRTCPFVGGLIENNLVINCKGYDMQIKGQLDTVRDNFAGASTDFQKTIIRYNVWSKDSGATPIGVGDGSRPCILMDNFPSTGYGANDMYEVYGNFFYNNPTEALMQVTGNTAAYNNVFVNHVAPSGYKTIAINDHNGFPPRAMSFFHNTILSNSPSGGIGLSNPDINYQQYCYANAVFSNGTAISGFQVANNVDNITDTYINAANYLNSSSATISLLNLFPKAGQLQGALTSNSLFSGFTDYDLDFNSNSYNWRYRGAYSGSGVNPGWPLQLAMIPAPQGTSTVTTEGYGTNEFLGMVHPNPADNNFQFNVHSDKNDVAKIILTDLEGKTLKTIYDGALAFGTTNITSNTSGLASGFYLVQIQMQGAIITRKLLIEK